MYSANPCAHVRESAAQTCQVARHVSVDGAAVQRLAAGIEEAQLRGFSSPAGFDSELIHYVDHAQPDLTAQALLFVDSLNFCFWPDAELEYEHLAGGVKAALLADPRALDAERLAGIDGPGVRALLGWPRALPLEEERARLLREVGAALLDRYAGQAANMVRAAEGSAPRLVSLLTEACPGFRDHAIGPGGCQHSFLKRAQIFVGDLWGAFGGEGLGAFRDIHELTMFADYRVPAVLRELGVLRYGAALAARVDGRQTLAAGSPEEVEVRAATIVAVEQLREAIAARLAALDAAAPPPVSVALDWWLWEQGERSRGMHRPHHRTLTIYY